MLRLEIKVDKDGSLSFGSRRDMMTAASRALVELARGRVRYFFYAMWHSPNMLLTST
jgi:ribosomal protein S12 methylthiotransferase accessory factor YcaO